MSAEPATLERKIDAMMAKLDLALARIDQAMATGTPGLTQKAFAKLLGCSARTVARRVAAKQIRLQHGLVPWSEAQKFLS